MTDQTQAATTVKRGRPPSAQQTKSTASGGNANRRYQKPSLSGRIGAMERTLRQQGDLLKRIVRGVS